MSRICRLALAIALVLAVAAPAAAAAPPRVVQASGLFTVGIDQASITAQPLPGGRCRITLLATFSFTGDLRGAFDPPAVFQIMKMGVCDPSVAALETFVARGTFVGSIAAASGSFGFVFRGTIDAANMARGQLIVTSGSGGLADLRGTVQLSGEGGCCGSYTGTLVL